MSSQKVVKLSPNFVETTDPNTRKPYYINMKTKQTYWAKPVEDIKKDIEDHKKPVLQDVWLERIDPSTGRTYYFNPLRKETSWHRPDKVISTDVHLRTVQGKDQWIEKFDPRTGRPYYYNPYLQKTSWDKPDDEEDEEDQAKKPAGGGGIGSQLKRMSVGLANRLSGFNRKSATNGGGPAGNRNSSARFSLAAPMPVDRNSARTSLRLGAGGDFTGDIFAPLRDMQLTARPVSMVGSVNVTVKEQESLLIDLEKEMNDLELHMDNEGDLKKYAEVYFRTTSKGFFGSKKTINIDQTIVWQKSMIKVSLHNFGNKDLNADALTAFRLLLAYCGEKSKKKQADFETARDFAALGLNTEEKFQSELYCQIMKQSTRNPRQDSAECCAELMAIICGVFKPPIELMPYVECHLRSKIENPQSARIATLAKHALLRLRKGKERLRPPSMQEVLGVRNTVPVELTVDLISASPVQVHADCWTTAGDIKKAIEGRFSIQDGTPFAMYEISNGDQERVLDADDNILDLMSLWAETTAAGGTVKIIYKIRLYFDINEDDTAAVELAYLQAVYEVIDQRYPCERVDAVKLAALEAQEKFGDFNGTDVFQDQLYLYVPHKFYSPEDAENLKTDIYVEYQKIAGSDKLQCMVNYLNYVKRWPYYGAAYYFAEPVQLKLLGKEFPKTVLIGINAKGVLIIEPQSLSMIVEYPYSELVTWGHSAQNFVLVVGNLVRSTKIFFSTVDGAEMNSLIHAYVNKLMEAQTDEEHAEMLARQFQDIEEAQ